MGSNTIRKMLRQAARILPARRRTYLWLLLPNVILGLLNLLLFLKPVAIDRILGAETTEAAKWVMPPPTNPPPPEFTVLSGRFPPGASLDILLSEKGFSASQIHEIFSASRKTYDLNKVRAGNRYVLEISTRSGALERFRYDIDADRYLTLEKGPDGWASSIRNYPFEMRTEALSGVITDNLFNAIVNSGERDLLALEMSNIFQWDVDFNTDLRVGDGFRLLVEKKYLDGEFAKYGSILAAELSNRGKIYMGFRYGKPGGRAEYYNDKGGALRRELRKSPLQFMAPISSKFSRRRFHPILKVYRPHLGIDYRAAEGTPVVAIADGRVTLIGRASGGGNRIRLRHRNGLSSMYLHLSRFASGLRAGSQVRQGQVIGYVGHTGLATGAHLDFRILKGNRYLNPAKVHGTPADPLPASQLPDFYKARDELLDRLAAVPLRLPSALTDH